MKTTTATEAWVPTRTPSNKQFIEQYNSFAIELCNFSPGQKGLGHLFSLFYVKTTWNQHFTVVMEIALQRSFPHSPWTMWRSFNCRIFLIHLWLLTSNIVQARRGRGKLNCCFYPPPPPQKNGSVSNVLTRVVAVVIIRPSMQRVKVTERARWIIFHFSRRIVKNKQNSSDIFQ